MIEEALKLTTYFGERDRAHGRFLADVLAEIYERHRVTTSVVFRGIAGFGLHHTLRTRRILTLSEDLPLISVAVDGRAKIERLLPAVRQAMGNGLLSLERARMAAGEIDGATDGLDPVAPAKLHVYAGRSERAGRGLAHYQAVEALRACGLTGASVVPAVDGTMLGERRRARFFARNEEVPLMLLAVGQTAAITAALPVLGRLFREPVLTLERVSLVKHDGRRLAEPLHVSEHDHFSGLPVWQKLTIHAAQQAKAGGRPLYAELVHQLRAHGAAGATVYRGSIGFYGNREPARDRLLALQRDLPVHTVIIDTPAQVRHWWPAVDELTRENGLVTSEPLPATHARSRSAERGGMDVDQVPPLPQDRLGS